jgi:hypothetical protein
MNDTKQACILVGANDVGNATPIDLFSEYYRQILDALAIAQFRVVHCGEIPRILADGHPYFARDSELRRSEYNSALEAAVSRVSIAKLVRFPELSESHLVDPVHFSEHGNLAIAQAFATSVKAY